MFLAAALALTAWRARPFGQARLAGALGGIIIATVLTTRIWGAMPPGDKFRGGFRDIPSFRPTTELEQKKRRDLIELAAKIPREARLAVSDSEHPHVSTRLNILALRSGVDEADYILYNEDGGGADNARRALNGDQWELVERRPDTRIALLRKKK